MILNNRGKVKLITILVIASISVATGVYAVENLVSDNRSNSKDIQNAVEVNQLKNKDDDQFVKEKIDSIKTAKTSKFYNKDEKEIEKLKSNLGNWEDVVNVLEKEKAESKKLSKDKVIELYDQGYGLQDIEQAEYLATLCDKPVEEILSIKGKTSDHTKSTFSKEQIQNQQGAEEKDPRSWDDVSKILNLDTRKVTDQSEMPDDVIKDLQNDGATDEEINQIALLSKNFGKDYEEIREQFKKGKKYRELNEQYKNEQIRKNLKKDLSIDCEQSIDNVIEEVAKNELKMTSDEIEKCKKNGLRGRELLSAKTLSKKYKISIDLVLELKKSKGDWKRIENELGGKAQ